MHRRRFLKAAGGGLAALALPGLPGWPARGGAAAPAGDPAAGARAWLAASGAAAERPPLPPLVTPTGEFFEVSKNLFWFGGDPRIRGGRWRLAVDGLVSRSLDLTLDDLGRLPAETPLATLQCISNEVGGPLLGTARWRGVPLARLLEQARPAAAAREIVFHCADGYVETLPLDAPAAEPAWLVYEMNGAPLPRSHGFPVRLLLPARYGMKSAKWVTRIELAAGPRRGYWQWRGGWDEEAWARTTSQVLAPRDGTSLPGLAPTWVTGIAHAGARGILAVEVSADGRRSWHRAWLEEPASPWAWVRWAWRWTPRPEEAAAPRRYALQVRAIDGTGALQVAADSPPFPSGATGLHGVLVAVES